MSGIITPKINFNTVAFGDIAVDCFLQGFDVNNGGKLSKMDSNLVLTVLEGGLPYKVYTALLTQSNTGGGMYPIVINAPVVDNEGGTLPYKDDFGGVWSYDSAGNYLYTKVGAFANKTKVDVFFNSAGSGADVLMLYTWISADVIKVSSARMSAFTSPSPASFQDGLMYQVRTEIRVYN